jgi:hypothetical protein
LSGVSRVEPLDRSLTQRRVDFEGLGNVDRQIGFRSMMMRPQRFRIPSDPPPYITFDVWRIELTAPIGRDIQSPSQEPGRILFVQPGVIVVVRLVCLPRDVVLVEFERLGSG